MPPSPYCSSRRNDNQHASTATPPSPPLKTSCALPMCSSLYQGALGLVTRLTTALQPCERKTGDKKRTGETTLEEDKEEAGGEGGMRDAVVAAARHLSGTLVFRSVPQ